MVTTSNFLLDKNNGSTIEQIGASRFAIRKIYSWNNNFYAFVRNVDLIVYFSKYGNFFYIDVSTDSVVISTIKCMYQLTVMDVSTKELDMVTMQKIIKRIKLCKWLFQSCFLFFCKYKEMIILRYSYE